MDRDAEIAIVGGRSPSKSRVEEIFAAVPREHFLCPGPWPILPSSGYVTTPDADPVYLYPDVLIGIAPERGLNK
jgi:protein-L-isoaspartate(D-aspartate) O-methyltransferase